MMFTQAVLAMVLLGNAAALWLIPFVTINGGAGSVQPR